MGYWLIAVLSIAVLALLGACAHPQFAPVPAPEDGVTVVRVGDWPNYAIGLTTCTEANKPIIILRDVPLDTIDAKIILIHEKNHARRMKADCQTTQALYKASLDFRREMELSAYCEDSRFALSLGIDLGYILSRLKGLMKQLYDLDEAHCVWLPP